MNFYIKKYLNYNIYVTENGEFFAVIATENYAGVIENCVCKERSLTELEDKLVQLATTGSEEIEVIKLRNFYSNNGKHFKLKITKLGDKLLQGQEFISNYELYSTDLEQLPEFKEIMAIYEEREKFAQIENYNRRMVTIKHSKLLELLDLHSEKIAQFRLK